MRRLTVVVSSFVLFTLLASPVFADPSVQALIPQAVQSAQKEATQDSVQIRLAKEHFDPLITVPATGRESEGMQVFGVGGIGYYIIQFDRPVEAAWMKDLEALGVTFFDYIPEFAFIVRMVGASGDAVRSHPRVRWLGVYAPAYKVSQQAVDLLYSQPAMPPLEQPALSKFIVTVFPAENIFSIQTTIIGYGGTIGESATTKWGTTLKIELPADKITALASIPGMKWIEPEPEWKLHNNVSADIMNVRTPRDTHGLYGYGQTVGIADSGLDTGSIATLHLDFSDGAGYPRVLSLIDSAGDGASDVSGHGTHVAGSVLGNGLMSGSAPISNSFPNTCGAGIAPKANLVFQSLGSNSSPGSLPGIPADLNTLFSQSQTAGANLHTNSWGSSLQSTYTSQSQNVDQYMWDNKDFLILYSAGNDGVDLDRDGVIDLYSLGAPSTAKNCLTVGASEGYRPSGAGYDIVWGSGSWLQKYFVAPITTDHVSNNLSGIAAFSSRGPTIDGRYKPDIVAPGTNILSTRSSVAGGTGWGAYNSYYVWNGGTSMATPLTAGTAALMREYLMSLNPSAALIKAALINSATDIYPGQYGYGLTQEIPSTVPNNVEGWGRVDLGNGVYPSSPYNILYADDHTGLNTAGSASYGIRVVDSSKPLKVNLVWTDYPGSPVAQGGLVNDLDLTVTDPALGVHYPDNAVHKAAVSTLSYNTNTAVAYSTTDSRAIRFTPLSYPTRVDSVTFRFANPSSTSGSVNVGVYAADGPGGLPGTQLFGKQLAYVPAGWHTIGVEGVVINSGDFYVAIAKTDISQGIYVDQDSNPTGRSYFYNGSSWAPSSYTAYIQASVRGNDYSTSYDRTNNVEGLTINNPAPGLYTLSVNGYNIPYGPQPYALIASGDITNSGSVTITTSPIGRQFFVDSNPIPYVAPQTFSWVIGSSHTLEVASPQDGTSGTRYVYSSWSDGGAQSHTITTPATTTTYTANFTTQYQLTTSIAPPASGSVSPDCSAGCWYNSGTLMSLSPTPWGSNTFNSWTGDISALDAPLAFTLNGPKNITANFDSTAVTGTVRIAGAPPAYFDSIPLAYGAAVNNDVIQTQATSYGSITFNRTDIPGLSLTLKGGYNPTYSDSTGQTTVGSPLTIQSGTIIVDNIVIQ